MRDGIGESKKSLRYVEVQLTRPAGTVLCDSGTVGSASRYDGSDLVAWSNRRVCCSSAGGSRALSRQGGCAGRVPVLVTLWNLRWVMCIVHKVYVCISKRKVEASVRVDGRRMSPAILL